MERLTEDYRRQRALNGHWQFVTDPEYDGRSDDWYDPDADWPNRTHAVEVPCAWQEDDAYREYTGAAWYRRTETLELPAEERVLLRFGAVDYEATVWVNGERVGENRGGYLPFELDVTDAVVEGENAIVVEVVDPADISEIPHGKQGAPWYQRISGIWQDVTLEFVPETRVERLRATPDLDDDSARIDFDVAGVDDSSSVTAAVRITRDGDDAARGETAIDADGSGSLTVSIEDPTYWTPETPALYDVTVDLRRDGQVVDRYEDYFGMRSVEARDGRLYLNGEPYYMRGALDQGYYPETLYRPFDESLFEEEVRTAKDLGFNLIRKHIKPAHPDFLECADRLGILVWEEPANPTVHTDRSKREVREQIEGLLERDYNRPSVIVWSLYNEEWGIGNPQGLDEETSLWEDEAKQEYLADLYDDISARDPTRIVCDNSGWAHVATDVNDYHRYFVSPDRAGAWETDIDAMADAPEENYGATETDPDDAPIIVSEFGTWGLCDLPAVEAHYDGTPPWFDYDFFDDPIKRPEGVHDRLEETTLPDVFDDWESLAEAWQWREFRSIKDVIERMRAREGVAGYVITEFSDIEWEFNGMLDYRREEKVFTDDFARINDDVLVMVEPDSHAVGAGDTLTADVVVSNHTNEPLEGEVTWSFRGREGRSRSIATGSASRASRTRSR
ncbi:MULTISPECIES: glycoside hydrolase family 2 protein [Natrialbaceae]|uniref:glycoside hydrolase family 2 protein n=1 Tax=Natrialbaceae TaxID=1644061 RepID=UPI00207CF97D|nr:sugar-binding domain-containing protein [Natronococcus sp. CG52]